MTDNEKAQIQRIMKGLGCDENEALKVFKADREIDRGQKKDFDLTPEQEKTAKKYRGTGTRMVLNLPKKARKSDETKVRIISVIAEFLRGRGDIFSEISVTNKERVISFIVDDERYELTLIKKRKTESGAGG